MRIDSMIQETFIVNNSEKVAELLKVLAHSIRLKIIDSLSQHRELNVRTIEQQIAISQSQVSQHLIKLNDRGILTSVRRSRENYYSLADPIVADWLTLRMTIQRK